MLQFLQRLLTERRVPPPLIVGSLLALGLSLGLARGQTVYSPGIVPPEITGGPWLNTTKGEPIKLSARKGKVTVLQFWTFGWINCVRNLPSYGRWQKQFEKQDVQIIGVHTPETEEEKVDANVEKQVKKLGITYPVLLDQKGDNWKRWEQRYWPTVYLIDKKGRVRYRWEGELAWKGARGEKIMAERIEMLLKEKA
jgi:peroxiredoxin